MGLNLLFGEPMLILFSILSPHNRYQSDCNSCDPQVIIVNSLKSEKNMALEICCNTNLHFVNTNGISTMTFHELMILEILPAL